MREEDMKQLFAELIHAQGEALGMVLTALCQQVDPARLKKDLQSTIAAAQKLPSTSSISIRIATHALAAAEAEKMAQARTPSEGPYPKRG